MRFICLVLILSLAHFAYGDEKSKAVRDCADLLASHIAETERSSFYAWSDVPDHIQFYSEATLLVRLDLSQKLYAYDELNDLSKVEGIQIPNELKFVAGRSFYFLAHGTQKQLTELQAELANEFEDEGLLQASTLFARTKDGKSEDHRGELVSNPLTEPDLADALVACFYSGHCAAKPASELTVFSPNVRDKAIRFLESHAKTSVRSLSGNFALTELYANVMAHNLSGKALSAAMAKLDEIKWKKTDGAALSNQKLGPAHRRFIDAWKTLADVFGANLGEDIFSPEAFAKLDQAIIKSKNP